MLEPLLNTRSGFQTHVLSIKNVKYHVFLTQIGCKMQKFRNQVLIKNEIKNPISFWYTAVIVLSSEKAARKGEGIKGLNKQPVNSIILYNLIYY